MASLFRGVIRKADAIHWQLPVVKVVEGMGNPLSDPAAQSIRDLTISEAATKAEIANQAILAEIGEKPAQRNKEYNSNLSLIRRQAIFTDILKEISIRTLGEWSSSIKEYDENSPIAGTTTFSTMGGHSYQQDLFSVMSSSPQNPDAVPNLIRKVLQDTGAAVIDQREGGATVNLAYISTNNKVIVGNIGDGRAIALIGDPATGKYTPLRLSCDHEVTDAVESARITASGFIDKGRVNGILAVARAIGDNEFVDKRTHTSPISCEPDVTTVDFTDTLRAGKKVIIINSTDGLYASGLHEKDLATITEAYLATGGNPNDLAQFLAKCAIKLNPGVSHDNVTLSAVVLNGAETRSEDLYLTKVDGHGRKGGRAAIRGVNALQDIMSQQLPGVTIYTPNKPLSRQTSPDTKVDCIHTIIDEASKESHSPKKISPVSSAAKSPKWGGGGKATMAILPSSFKFAGGAQAASSASAQKPAYAGAGLSVVTSEQYAEVASPTNRKRHGQPPLHSESTKRQTPKNGAADASAGLFVSAPDNSSVGTINKEVPPEELSHNLFAGAGKAPVASTGGFRLPPIDTRASAGAGFAVRPPAITTGGAGSAGLTFVEIVSHKTGASPDGRSRGGNKHD